MVIICLSGKAGAGKDTAADVLVRRYAFRKMSFADPLRDLCSRAFGLHMSNFLDRNLKDKEFDVPLMLDYSHIDKIREIVANEWGFEINYETREDLESEFGEEFRTPRHLLQFIGTDFLRKHVEDDIFIIQMVNLLKKVEGPVVISDCRFFNERDTLRQIGAIIGLIDRPGILVEDGHISENQIGKEKDYHVVFKNNSTQEAFESEVDMWYCLRRSALYGTAS